MQIKQVNEYGIFCILHDDIWLQRQRIAGNVAGQTLSLLKTLVKEKTVKSLLELDKIAEKFIIANGCVPTFKNYKGFPASVCMSLDNDTQHMLVHGIPFDYILKEHDIISFDLGATFEGAIGDTAITCIYGEPASEMHMRLLHDTEEALTKAIHSVAVGKKIGIIGHTIYNSLSKSYGIVTNYGGHSLNYDTPHSPPFISNKSSPNDGITIQNGMTLAIEPLVVIDGSVETWVGDDKWTVFTKNTSAHFEHTIYIHEDRVEVITAREEENEASI